MRRLAPRPIAAALEGAIGAARPAGLLAAVQGAWREAAGAALAEAATPVSEREGVITVACQAAVWAQELELLGSELLDRLNERLEAAGEPGRVERVRFVIGSGANRRA